MVRFPERFHASVTPGASQIGVEPNYLEEPVIPVNRLRQRRNVRGSPEAGTRRFDFTALDAAMGRT